MKFRRPAQDSLEINLTPLIDCLLFLIVFFLLTTTFLRPSKLQISLPEAGGDSSPVSARNIEVAVSASGNYAVNGQVLATTQPTSLRSAIEKASGGSRELPFIISADSNTPHQAVVTVMDVAGQMGFESLSISTRQSAKK